MKAYHNLIIAMVFLVGCVSPQVISKTPVDTDFRGYETVSITIKDRISTSYSKEAGLILEGMLSGKLRAMGYELDENKGDFKITVTIKSAKKGSKALQFWVGFGAGRALLLFDARFNEANGRLIGEFTGGKSYTGMELKDNAIYKSYEEMQMGMIVESVLQIAKYIRLNGQIEEAQQEVKIN